MDDHTVVIETDQPDPILLNEILNVWIVSRKNGGERDDGRLQLRKAAIGTGPYRVVEWVPGDHITLERFDGYFGAKPDWQRVTYKPITSDASRVAALLSGDVDLINNVPGNDVATLKANPKVTLGTMESNRCYFWTLDVDRDASPQITDADGKPLTKNPLKDERVRRAMSMAIDRAALVSKVMQGQAVEAAQFNPQGHAWDEREAEAGGVRSGGGEEAARRGWVCERLRRGGELQQRPLSERRAGEPGGRADVEPAGTEDLGECGAQGDLFPSGGQAGVQRVDGWEFHGYGRASVAVAVSVGDLHAVEGDGGGEFWPLLRSEVRRDHRQGGDDTGRRQAQCVAGRGL